jgi:SHS2 domain-containing protein
LTALQSGSKAAAWEHFAHGADIGVRGIGTTVEEAFEQAALAMMAVITDPVSVTLQSEIEISCEAPELDLLLLDWLNALVLKMATDKLVFGSFAVSISGPRLHAIARGEPIDVRRHQPAVEVKGATLTELSVARGSDGLWRAQCIVDV